MATLIRFPDETDAEYDRRVRPFVQAFNKELVSKQIASLYGKGNVLSELLRMNRFYQVLKEQGNERRSDTFKWDIGS